MLSGRNDLFGCPRSKPSQGSVPADLTLANDLTFVFNVSRVRLECCVDLLKPPDLSGVGPHRESRSHFKTRCIVTTLDLENDIQQTGREQNQEYSYRSTWQHNEEHPS